MEGAGDEPELRLAEVLGCPPEQALFFWEAAGRDFQTAVNMYYEHSPSANPPASPPASSPRRIAALGVAQSPPPPSPPTPRISPPLAFVLAASRVPVAVLAALLRALLRVLGAPISLIARALPEGVIGGLRRLARAAQRPNDSEWLSPEAAAAAFRADWAALLASAGHASEAHPEGAEGLPPGATPEGGSGGRGPVGGSEGVEAEPQAEGQAEGVEAEPQAEEEAEGVETEPRPEGGEGGATSPDWVVSSWREAASRAQRSGKLLFTYLHADQSAAARRFALEVLAEGRVRAQLERRYVAWGGDTRHADPRSLAAALGVRRPPHVALLELERNGRIRLVAYASGATTAPALVDLLIRAGDEHEAVAGRAAAEEAHRREARELRAEQDEQLARSLREDRAREAARQRERDEAERRGREESERRERERSERAEREAGEAARLEAVRARKAARAAALAPEPAPAPGGPKTALLRLRLPTGAAAQRRFRADDPLQAVADWADGLPETADVDAFALVRPFPKKLYEPAEFSKSLEELELTSQAALLFQPLDD